MMLGGGSQQRVQSYGTDDCLGAPLSLHRTNTDQPKWGVQGALTHRPDSLSSHCRQWQPSWPGDFEQGGIGCAPLGLNDHLEDSPEVIRCLRMRITLHTMESWTSSSASKKSKNHSGIGLFTTRDLAKVLTSAKVRGSRTSPRVPQQRLTA